jgi:hypothetical protein
MLVDFFALFSIIAAPTAVSLKWYLEVAARVSNDVLLVPL